MPNTGPRLPIVLASSSAARRRLLAGAGVDFTVDPSAIDEDRIKVQWEGRPEALARELARAKALDVAARHPGALVIGADQVLASASQTLGKPGTPAKVREQLAHLRGREHRLISAAAVALGPDVVWDHVDTAHMHVRDFSPEFLDDYVARVGEQVAASVGGYHLEGLGAQLFDRVEGDHFTVQGLPLFALLECLRAHGALPV